MCMSRHARTNAYRNKNVRVYAQAIIFVNTKRKAEWLAARMAERDFETPCLHGDMTSLERDQTVRKFRSGASRGLVVTDTLARGVDTHSLVVNYDLPTNPERYIFRIGWSGRYRPRGFVAVNFVTADDVPLLRDVERFYGTGIEEMPLNVADLF